jgi:hypothetical protein
MKRFVVFILFFNLLSAVLAQWQGRIADAITGEALPSASVILYSHEKRSGLVTNKEGIFSFTALYDSMHVSMVGYHSKTVTQKEFLNVLYFEIKLDPAPADLGEVVIKTTTALDIIKQTIAAIPSFQPINNFESTGFYREIIKNKDNYFSVAEAVFAAQYAPVKGSYKLKLIQGRSKEDVSYTRLFEDYHPGGGPQSTVSRTLFVEAPDFLNEKKLKWFSYKIDSLVQFDGRWLYSISFDQKPDVKKALEKGKLLIDADEFSVIRYEAQNSPIGEPYIKDLTGSDKIMAALLNIDFKRKSWKHRVDFIKVNDKWLLSYVESERKIGYKQPKKDIDLDLTIKSEMLFTDLQSPIARSITDEEEWKRKNLVSNLPSAFDPSFWGGNTIISPTTEVKNIVETISKNNNETPAMVDEVNDSTASGWQYKNRNLFVSYYKKDTIMMIPTLKCGWEDEQSGGMLFKEIQGNFSIETKINITKINSSEMPDKGFQQAGIIIRKSEDQKENYVYLSIGTAGNPSPKIVLKKTIANKSRTSSEKIDNMNVWLKLDKKGKSIIAWTKQKDQDNWTKQGEYGADWLNEVIQFGLAVYAGFPGDGPKMKPDMKAEFTQLKVEMQ